MGRGRELTAYLLGARQPPVGCHFFPRRLAQAGSTPARRSCSPMPTLWKGSAKGASPARKPDRGCREGRSAYRSRVCRAARQDRKSTDGPGSDVRFWSTSRLTSWPRPNKESSWPHLNWSEWAGITCPLSHLSPNPRACWPPSPIFLWRWRRGFVLARPWQVRSLHASLHAPTPEQQDDRGQCDQNAQARSLGFTLPQNRIGRAISKKKPQAR